MHRSVNCLPLFEYFRAMYERAVASGCAVYGRRGCCNSVLVFTQRCPKSLQKPSFSGLFSPTSMAQSQQQKPAFHAAFAPPAARAFASLCALLTASFDDTVLLALSEGGLEVEVIDAGRSLFFCASFVAPGSGEGASAGSPFVSFSLDAHYLPLHVHTKTLATVLKSLTVGGVQQLTALQLAVASSSASRLTLRASTLSKHGIVTRTEHHVALLDPLTGNRLEGQVHGRLLCCHDPPCLQSMSV